MKKNISTPYLITGLIVLLIGAFFGCIGMFQFVFPGWLKETLPFQKVRPLHVSMVVFWIFLAAIGSILHYLNEEREGGLWSPRLARFQFGILLAAGFVIIGSYLAGIFGGREYLEFPPILGVPIIVSWLFYALNFWKSIPKPFDKLPIYYWMWGTGILLFILAFSEAYLWLIPYFNDNVIREATVQWKSYGALVGSWNMMIYGSAVYVMYRISGDDKALQSKTTFSLFFVGFLNSLFNWGHHTYIIPTPHWVKYVAYGVSMLELLILWKVIRDWLKSLSAEKSQEYKVTQKFFFAADTWIVLNLILSILISIPAINAYTHGTHITVAHAMGSTIGINTMLLLASVFFILMDTKRQESSNRQIHFGYYLLNLSLLVFFVSLIGAGIARSRIIFEQGTSSGISFWGALHPYMVALGISGTGIFIGLLLIVAPLLCPCRDKLDSQVLS